uniref:CAP-Gly domain-containing protein n=2 Tax=Ornithorhynchus anatinus TaxID=9258 RepID=A0A6I8NUG9_ORNAN
MRGGQFGSPPLSLLQPSGEGGDPAVSRLPIGQRWPELLSNARRLVRARRSPGWASGGEGGRRTEAGRGQDWSGCGPRSGRWPARGPQGRDEASRSGGGGGGGMDVAGVSAPVVTVFISSSLNSFRSEKRYNRGLTLAEFKCKLELVVGSPASCMDLELYGIDDKFCMKLDRDDALLGSYPVEDGCRIHVIDRSGARIGEYEDLSRVEKYEISQSAYEKRPDSVRSFLKRSKMGKFNEEEQSRREAEQEQRLAEEKALAEAMTVGSRCQVRAAGQPAKLGTVMYVGLTEFKPGYWVGVRYDEPLGKHDGSVSGKRYFQCQPKYGAFVKPQSVTVGDFPEEDYGLDEM